MFSLDDKRIAKYKAIQEERITRIKEIYKNIDPEIVDKMAGWVWMYGGTEISCLALDTYDLLVYGTEPEEYEKHKHLFE
jgi:hypothetical protein